MKPAPHDFATSLKKSHAAEDLPFWEVVYRQAFPNMIAMHNHRKDGPHQRNGVDRSIVLANSKQILIDEKVRWKNQYTGKVYRDIALEYISNDQRNEPGWVCKSLMADYIAYAIAPLGICYLLPVLQLQSVWAVHGAKWIEEIQTKKRPHIRAQNNGYITHSVGVMPQELFALLGNAHKQQFTPIEEEDMEFLL